VYGILDMLMQVEVRLLTGAGSDAGFRKEEYEE
jgi:hypothetical protein